MNGNKTQNKPDIHWMEGLLDLYGAQFPHGNDDPRMLGFNVGQQITGLYIVEMLLKYALDARGVPHGRNHNLLQLFRNLPRQQRRLVERKYKELLNSEVESTWDVAKTVEALLDYLGNDPITDTRYFWEPGRGHVASFASILIAPRMLRPVIYAFFIVLHRYPSKPIKKKFDTKFDSLADSFANEPGANS